VTHRPQIIPKRATDPPEVFHWLPFIGSAISYGNDPLRFFFECREKVCTISFAFKYSRD
jgi:sterol 14-demethylase